MINIFFLLISMLSISVVQIFFSTLTLTVIEQSHIQFNFFISLINIMTCDICKRKATEENQNSLVNHKFRKGINLCIWQSSKTEKKKRMKHLDFTFCVNIDRSYKVQAFHCKTYISHLTNLARNETRKTKSNDTVDLDYTCNNIGCKETSTLAKRFSGTFFFFSKQLY